MFPHLQPSQSIQSLGSLPAYAVTNVVVLRRDTIQRREAQRMNETMAGPSKLHGKQHPLQVVSWMGITSAMIHHVAMDLEQGVNLNP